MDRKVWDQFRYNHQFLLQGLYQFLGDSTSPGNSLLRFNLYEKKISVLKQPAFHRRKELSSSI